MASDLSIRHVHFVAGLDQNARFVHFFRCASVSSDRTQDDWIGHQLGSRMRNEEDARLVRATFSECVLTGEPTTCVVYDDSVGLVHCRFDKVVQNSNRSIRSVDEVAAVAVACQLPGRTELSRREQEIVRLICKDKSIADIAAELKIAGSTVETHRQNIRKRIGANGTAGIVIYAMRHGLMDD